LLSACLWLPMRLWLRSLLVAGCAAYGIGLLVGPTAGVALVSAGCFALLGSVTLLPLTAAPQTLDQWRKWVEAKRPRQVGLAVYHATLALVAAEALLRGVHLFDRAELFTATTADIAATAAETPPGRPGVLRVAIIECLAADVASGESSCARELAQPAAGLEICRLRMRTDGPSSVWRAELAAFRPDVVLGLVALEQGLKTPAAGNHPFDWRSLETLRLAAGLLGLTSNPAVDRITATAAGTRADKSDVHRLAICRTPLDQRVNTQWRETFAELDELVAGCAALDARLAFVVVPDGFQVNRVLCDTLRRRAGYQAGQLDLELPQRRLATYAQERGLMLVDLLPYLRASREPVYHPAAGGWNDQARQVANRAVTGWLHSQCSGLAASVQLSRGR
jgi:hypothetical protein